MADEEKEEKRVTLDDVVEVLAKHATTPNDPDDADTVSRFNQQVIDEREKEQGGGGTRAKDTSESTSQKDSPESPQGGSQPTGTQRKGR